MEDSSLVNKSLTRTLFIPGVILEIIGFIVAGLSVSGATTSATGVITGANSGEATIAVLLYAVGGILVFVSYIGSLIKAAQLNRWGWFVGILIGAGIGLLLWQFIGPETKKV